MKTKDKSNKIFNTKFKDMKPVDLRSLDVDIGNVEATLPQNIKDLFEQEINSEEVDNEIDLRKSIEKLRKIKKRKISDEEIVELVRETREGE